MRLSILVIPATRITARVSVVSSELSVRTRAAISQTTGSKLKRKEKQNIMICKIYKYVFRINPLAYYVLLDRYIYIFCF